MKIYKQPVSLKIAFAKATKWRRGRLKKANDREKLTLLLQYLTRAEQAEQSTQEQAALIERLIEALRRIATQYPNDTPEEPNAIARKKCEQAKEALSLAHAQGFGKK